VQLLDKDLDNVADADMVAQVIDAAMSELSSYIQVVVDLTTLVAPYPFALVSKTADVAAFYAWRYGAYGQAIPENVVQGYDKAISWAQDVAAKKATLGAVRKQALDQPVGVRDFDELGSKVSIAGFKKGFRSVPFQIAVNVDGVVRKMDTLASNAHDLSPALARIGGYLKQNALRKYKEQGFAPLAASTLEKRAAKGLNTLERKLGYDLKKAKARAWDARRASGAAPRGAIARTLAKLTMGDMLGAQAVADTRGVQNRTKVLEEFRRRHRGGAPSSLLLSAAQTKSLNDRETRAVAKQLNKPILGGLSRTLGFKVANGSVTLKSMTYEHFSGVHNEGGAVGHGASVPARTTIKIDETDVAVFRAILADELMVGVGED
jgi:phage gp36-like protein